MQPKSIQLQRDDEKELHQELHDSVSHSWDQLGVLWPLGNGGKRWNRLNLLENVIHLEILGGGFSRMYIYIYTLLIKIKQCTYIYMYTTIFTNILYKPFAICWCDLVHLSKVPPDKELASKSEGRTIRASLGTSRIPRALDIPWVMDGNGTRPTTDWYL